MDIDHSLIPLKEIHIHPSFSNLFPKSLPVLYGLKKHIRDNGFDTAFPLILAYGPWTQHDVLIDGHCRRQVCEELRIEKVPVVRRYFATEDEALEYMIHIQKDRRNLTDAEITSCVATLDQLKIVGRPNKLASCQANFETGKSAERTAAILGVSRDKVEKVRTILKHGDSEMKQSIQSGKSINKVYNEIQTRRKMEQAQLELQQEVSEQPAQIIDNPPEQDIDHDMVHDLTSEVNDPEDARSECWIADIIDSLESASIDYVVVGEGIPPANLAEGQQIFVAPWMAATQRETDNDAEDVLNEEAAPPQKPDIVNLSNYDAEGWEALEQAWAKYIPDLVSKTPQVVKGATVIEETTGNAAPFTGDGHDKRSNS